MIATAVALQVFTLLVPGVAVDGIGSALSAAALFGLLNALLWPLLVRFLLPITVLTIGLGALLLNGLMVLAISAIIPGFSVGSIWSAIALAFGLSLANVIVTTALAIDDDDWFFRNVVRRQARRRGATTTVIPGVVFVQIDGLGREVLLRAIRDGDAPTMAGWLRRGDHRLMGWETDWSSQTGASQAGLLQGSNADMPAFRWWEKERNRPMVSNHPRDAMEIERRHSNGRGLLSSDGASRGNVVSGDASRSSLTMSTVLTRHREGQIGRAYYGYFANPYNLTRTIVLAIREVFRERRDAARQRRWDVQPRINRNFSYALLRAWTCVIQRDLQIQAVIGDMYEGRAAIYTDILGYDEVAHHSGVERADALRVLRDIDRQLARLERAAHDTPRPYRIVVLSDHGQSQGPSFAQRYGESLETLVRASTSGAVDSSAQGDESRGYLAGSLDEAATGKGVIAAAARRLRPKDAHDRETPSPEVVVMASGNLGLIYFPRRPGRLTVEDIEVAYPQLLKRLRDHPGVGFLLVRSRRDGPMVIGKAGSRLLDADRVTGTDPLLPYGTNAARHILRTDAFTHTADIMVNSAIDVETGDVFAFEELVGSHGGLGGAQSFPFLLMPADWPAPERPLVGAEAVHQQLRRWLACLGQAGFSDGGGPESARLDTYI